VVAVADHGSWGGSRLAACRRHSASHLAGLGSAPSGRTGEPCPPSPWCADVPPHAARARGDAHRASLPASEAASYRHTRHVWMDAAATATVHREVQQPHRSRPTCMDPNSGLDER